jgi:hypothetical protein
VVGVAQHLHRHFGRILVVADNDNALRLHLVAVADDTPMHRPTDVLLIAGELSPTVRNPGCEHHGTSVEDQAGAARLEKTLLLGQRRDLGLVQTRAEALGLLTPAGAKLDNGDALGEAEVVVIDLRPV